jgi:hypothetical protein
MLVVVVLGMHKSGTSLVSEIIHHSGIEMVEATPSATYDTGQHYERLSTNAINKDLLQSSHLHSLETTRPLDMGKVNTQARRRAESLVGTLMTRGKDWGFKDPRTCLTYGFWKEILPDHKLVCIFRDVFEVYQHYRGKKRRGMQALHAWYVYNRALLEAYQQAPAHSRLLIDYGALMSSDLEVDRIGRFLGRKIEDRRNHSLRRSRPLIGLQSRGAAAIYRLKTGNDVRELNLRLRQLAQRNRDG